MAEGEIIQIDEFQLVNCIASGTYSQIWEVREKDSPETHAMKLLLKEARQDPEQLKAFKHEATVARSFDHPLFLKVHKTVIKKKQAYFTMDYFRAPNVKVLIQSDPTIVQVRLAKLVESVCSALGHMHEKGWVHKDVKPDNILFSKGSDLRLIDFSLSTRIVAGLGKLFAGKVDLIQGTRTYIAPETLRKQHAVPQTDMYSFGVTLFEVLTGFPAFRGMSPDDLLRKHAKEAPAPPSEFNPNVTPEMDKLVLRLLAKKPEQRFASMSELHAEFRKIKPFKEDPAEYAEKKRKQAEDVYQDSTAARLDSRADAERGGRRSASSPPVAPRPASRPVAAPEPPPRAAPHAPAAAPPPPMRPAVPQPVLVPPITYPPQPMPAMYPQPMPVPFAPPPIVPASYPPAAATMPQPPPAAAPLVRSAAPGAGSPLPAPPVPVARPPAQAAASQPPGVKPQPPAAPPPPAQTPPADEEPPPMSIDDLVIS